MTVMKLELACMGKLHPSAHIAVIVLNIRPLGLKC